MSDFKAKMHQIRLRLGLRPRPLWGSLQRSPDPVAGLRGATSKGREGRRESERQKRGGNEERGERMKKGKLTGGDRKYRGGGRRGENMDGGEGGEGRGRKWKERGGKRRGGGHPRFYVDWRLAMPHSRVENDRITQTPTTTLNTAKQNIFRLTVIAVRQPQTLWPLLDSWRVCRLLDESRPSARSQRCNFREHIDIPGVVSRPVPLSSRTPFLIAASAQLPLLVLGRTPVWTALSTICYCHRSHCHYHQHSDTQSRLLSSIITSHFYLSYSCVYYHYFHFYYQLYICYSFLS